jgi:formylglycine-generating enzyme required for sulfatase activity
MLHAGAGDWEAESRIASHDALVAPFEIDKTEVTEAAYGECLQQGRCATVPLSGEPGRAISGVTRAEAEAVCRFLGGRLPTNDEWTWTAGGARSRRYPWGDTGAVCRRGVWGLANGPCGFGGDGPEVSGVHVDGATPEGVVDLAGNVAEWVSDGTETAGFVRGGSWASGLATELRTWLLRGASPSGRSRENGVRCAYPPSTGSVVTSTAP